MKGKPLLCLFIICCLLLTPFHGVAAEADTDWVAAHNAARYRGTLITQAERVCYTEITTCASTRVEQLAKEITAGLTTDTARLRAVYDWVRENIVYDMAFEPRPLCSCMRLDLTEAALRTKKTNAKGLSELMAQLCRAADLPAQMVGGYVLASSEKWSLMHRRMTLTTDSNHWWNEAYVDGHWLIFDAAEDVYDPPAETFFETRLKLGAISDGVNLYVQDLKYGEGVVAFSRPLDRSITAITVPEKVGDLTVNMVGAAAFYGCEALVSITLPATVVRVGDQAFAGTAITEAPDLSAVQAPAPGLFKDCTALRRFAFPAHWTEAPASMFEGCTALQEITAPAGVITKVGNYAFAGTAITEAPDLSATKDGANYLFKDCQNLRRFDVPRGWASVKGTFSGCTSLAEVTLPLKVQKINSDAFRDCIALTEVTLPPRLTHLGNSVFAGSGITRMQVAEGVELNKRTFADCQHLQEVTLPADLTAIPYGLFQNCTALEKVVIPAGVTAIEESAFEGCASLTALDLPEGLTSLGPRALANSGLISLTLPASLTALGKESLAGLFKLEKIAVTKGNAVYQDRDGVLFAKTPVLTLVQYPLARPNTDYTVSVQVRRMADRAFAGASRLETLYIHAAIPTSVEWGQETFRDCTALRQVVVGEGVRVLPWHGFQGCTALTELSLPDSLVQLYLADFAGCTALTHLTVPAGVSQFTGIQSNNLPGLLGVDVAPGNRFWGDIDGVVYRKENKCLTWYPPARTATSYAVPDIIASIDASAFEDAAALSTVTLPEGLKSIGDRAFAGTSLTALDLPDSVTAIAATAMANTPWWEAQPRGPVYLEQAFMGFKGYGLEREISIAEGTRLIARGALKDCKYLRRLSVPASVTRVTDLETVSYSVEAVLGKTGSAAEAFARQRGILFADPARLSAGDTDADGTVTSTDARLMLQYTAFKVDEYELFLHKADVDGDGAYTTTDARLILQYAAGKIEGFPVPKT